ncbi:MAG: hypothetical protein MUE63_03460 [Xanthomonadales bacterium]|jgi:hypothetical protein|nr:hypothetical protein [Xanthomonadales bacterium]
MIEEVFWGRSPVRQETADSGGGFVERDGETFYRISNYDRMPPFFMTVVSGFDHWMFVSSTGGMTCGRRDPENALFPYETDDRIHDADATTGSRTILLVRRGGQVFLWKPFAREAPVYQIERNLLKNLAGNRLVFEEINRGLGLAFSCEWSTSDRFGFVRKSTIRNTGEAEVRLELLDGLRNLLPFGVSRVLQSNMSTLLDAYKQAESHVELCAAIYTLSSIPSDRAEPSEALAATVAWGIGLDRPQLLLSEDQVAAFCAGTPVHGETFSRGKRGAFFLQSTLRLAPGAERTWYLLADVEQGPAQVPALFEAIRRGVSAGAVDQDVARGTRRLLSLAGGADGCQLSSDPLVTARHFSNTLFNIMRGGTFYDGCRLPSADFLDFAGRRNGPVREKFAALPVLQRERLALTELAAAARNAGDPHMERLVLEYLPLMFSRRHGDPSRPWNRFSIDLRNPDGSDRLHYEGNWRDIFQNWEGLAISYPEYIESFIARFVNASTADGYNPYRISREGFDWEVLDADDPWSNIGYWGDHQGNYLLRLLDLSRRYHPGRLGELLERELFVYANVPYRLKGYAALLQDPRSSVEYDAAEAADIAVRVAQTGSDGKLLALADGSICRVSLLEKLLVPALVKIGNFVPAGGIWMNTQRPEWNDANNALVGYGLSMVTLCYLRRYLVLLADLLEEHGSSSYTLSGELADFLDGLDRALGRHRAMREGDVTAAERKTFMDELGALGEAYRTSVYAGFSGQKERVSKSGVLAFIRITLEYLDHSIARSRRPDGLYHTYRLVHFAADGHAVEDLAEMLEGQVAVLNSGCLDTAESLALLDALRASHLYRSDQDSYMLYPERNLPRFLDKNLIAPDLVADNPWMQAELASGRSCYLVRDVNGAAHFRPQFRNAVQLAAALRADPAVAEADAGELCAVYEAVFGHRHFTGRSGTMYKYEGLGCIYWHMVSKLALTIAETITAAARAGVGAPELEGLCVHFDQVRNGLGMNKTPAAYGAFPTDPYSHTPAFAGVQQPGMTGQVKEDILTRFEELGIRVEQGAIAFEPILLRRAEFLSGPRPWRFETQPEQQVEELPAGSLAFTLCGVPVIYRLAASAAIRVFTDQDEPVVIPGSNLGRDWTRSLCLRDGRLLKIEVELPQAALR